MIESLSNYDEQQQQGHEKAPSEMLLIKLTLWTEWYWF